MNELGRFQEIFGKTLMHLEDALTDPDYNDHSIDFSDGIEYAFEKIVSAYKYDCETSLISLNPPLGVVPEHIHDSIRAEVLREAMQRYLEDSTQSIPFEWFKEYNVLIHKLESSPY